MTILVTYATRHGSTAGIAEQIAATLRAHGLDVDIEAVSEVSDVTPYDAVVLGGAASMFHWLKDATSFAKRHRAELRKRPVWLFSSGPLGRRIATWRLILVSARLRRIGPELRSPLARSMAGLRLAVAE